MSPGTFETSYYAREHHQDLPPNVQDAQTPSPLSQDEQGFPAKLTPPIFLVTSSDPYAQQAQLPFPQEPFNYERAPHYSISSEPTTPFVPEAWVHGVWSPPLTVQESQTSVDQTQPSSEFCSNGGSEFQDHSKSLRGAQSLIQGPVEQLPVGVGLWIGESRLPGDRTLTAATTSDGLDPVKTDEIPPPASQASTSLSTKRRTKAQMSEKSDKNPHLCDRCSNTYPSNNELNRHIRSKHIRQKHPHKCPHEDCELTFRYPKDLRRHNGSIHLGHRFCCRDKECGSVFSREDNRDRHEREKHGQTHATSRSSSSQAS